MKKKILITTLVAIVVCIGYFATLAYQDKEDVGNGEVVQGEEIGDTEEPANKIEETLAPIVEETDEPSGEPTADTTSKPVKTVTPTKAPTKEPVVTEKPTKEPTKKPVATVKPTKAPTKAPVVTKNPTKAPTKKPTVKPTIKPTVKPVKTPTPTKKASKTYWYEVPIKEDGNSGHKYVESELSPEKYPVPDGYEPWRGPDYDYLIGDYVYWTQPLLEDVNNILAYKNDGSPDLRNTVVNKLDEEYMLFLLDSSEIKKFTENKDIGFINYYSINNTMSPYGPNDIRSYIYEIRYTGKYSDGGVLFFFDKNYNVTEKDPYK